MQTVVRILKPKSVNIQLLYTLLILMTCSEIVTPPNYPHLVEAGLCVVYHSLSVLDFLEFFLPDQ